MSVEGGQFENESAEGDRFMKIVETSLFFFSSSTICFRLFF